MSKALGYISIAKKAGALAVGETNAGAAVRAGKGRVLLLASDASPNARHRAEGFVTGTQTPLVVSPFSKAELSEATGAGGCSMAAFTDVGAAFTGAKQKSANAQKRGRRPSKENVRRQASRKSSSG